MVGLRFQYDAGVSFDTTTGNVGVGTTNPQSELEVQGTVAAKTFASTSPLLFHAPPGSERLRIDDVTARTRTCRPETLASAAQR